MIPYVSIEIMVACAENSRGISVGVYIFNIVILAIIGLFVEFAFRSKISRMLYCSYAWLQMTLIAALRWCNGIDYNQYYNTFYEIARTKGWSVLLERREELGFLFFNRAVSYISDNIIVYLFLYYGVMFGLLLWYIYKYSELKWLSVIAFIAFDYFAMSLCFMRQSMAMVIGLYALEMMKKRKWGLVILLTFCASLFHVSALILLVGLAFSYIKLDTKKVWTIAILTSVVLYFGCDFILQHLLVGPFEKYADYLGSQFMNGNHILVVYYPIFCFGLVAFFYKKLCKVDENFSRIFPVLFLGIVLGILSTKHYIIERMALYITLYNIRIVEQVLALFKNEAQKWNYQLAVYSAIVISAGAFVFGISNDRYWIRPYKLNETYLYEHDWFKDIGHDNTVKQNE